MTEEKVGRPTALTPEIHNRVIAYIKAGGYVETAAAAAGVNKSTLYNWLKRGAKEDAGIYRDFSESVEKAMAEAEMIDVARINKAAQDGVWQAAAWRLERKHPDRWGKKEKHEHTGADGGPISLKGLSSLSLEQIESKIAEITARLPTSNRPSDSIKL